MLIADKGDKVKSCGVGGGVASEKRKAGEDGEQVKDLKKVWWSTYSVFCGWAERG